MFELEEELKKLPEQPGVYLMHDAADTVIYVGKAKILKNRVRQYFQSGKNHSPKIKRMVEQIAYFEYIVVDSELEAFILECNLIKEYRPRYNTMLRDDKSYPYIRVTVQEPYPRVLYSHRQGKDKARYFGPYANAGAAKHIIELINRAYCLRTCARQIPAYDAPVTDGSVERPCLYHQMGQCSAPCQGYLIPEEYGTRIQEILEFLAGNHAILTRKLERQMKEAAERLAFEEAAEYRDLIEDCKALMVKQKATETKQEERDVIAYAIEGEDAVVQMFFVRDGKIIGREHCYVNGAEAGQPESLLKSFIQQFYAGTPYIPRELLVSVQPEEMELLAEWLTQKRGQRVAIKVPQRGTKERLIELAQQNAQMILRQDADKLKRERERTVGASLALAEAIGLPQLMRIESYDISNTSGFASVGSMVVYEDGKQKKSDYRKFRLKTVEGPDDYASMREVLTRRFTHEKRANTGKKDSFSRLPDLILMDGGKGQVSVAEAVLAELSLSIPVCGMVKDDRHRTRGLYVQGREIPLDTHGAAFHLVTRIQDETHRFAIDYHRSLRTKAQVHSVLDEIAGIGPSRRRALMKSFESLERVRQATVEELAAVPSMNRRAAEELYQYFRKDKADTGRAAEEITQGAAEEAVNEQRK